MPIQMFKTLYFLVDNEFGVLTRITALLRREGWNIRSLTVDVTQNPKISQMLICVECIPSTLPKVLGRLRSLSCVHEARPLYGFDLTQELKDVFQKLEKEETDHAQE